MGYGTPHSIMRFIERVNIDLPRKKKQKEKIINSYMKKAYALGVSISNIKDNELKSYMIHKLNNNVHAIKANKITLYNNNLFLFANRKCITVLNVPDDINAIDDVIAATTNLKKYINKLKESKKVKLFLLKNSIRLDSEMTYKKIIIDSYNFTYSYIINNFPTNAIDYIKNDGRLRQLIIQANKHRNENIKHRYYVIGSLLLLFPKKEIMKILDLFRNKKCGFVDIINKKRITKKQIDVCYKQLSILLGYKIKPQFEDFKVSDYTCGPLLYDYIMTKLDSQILYIKKLYKEKQDVYIR